MLKKINANGVESSTGFVIQVVGPDILEYRCNGKIMEVDWMHDQGKRITYIYVSDSAEFYKLTSNEKKQMIEDMEAAFNLLGGDFEIV